MHSIEDAESWKVSPEPDLRRVNEASEYAKASSRAKDDTLRLLPTEMAVQPARNAESPKRPSVRGDQKTTIIEYDDGNRTAPRYSDKQSTENETWDVVAESKRRTERTDHDRRVRIREKTPRCPRQQQQALTQALRRPLQRTLLLTPEDIFDSSKCIGAEVLCREDVYLLWTAGVLPPVTATSLAELDLQRIMNNTKIRADINFDGDLQFRPNLDGPKGKKKCTEAKQYWRALAVELLVYRVHCSERDCWELPTFASIVVDHQEKTFISRLPLMFQTIRAILNTLIPEQERLLVEARIDIPFLMQQIQRGCFDFECLSMWLAQVLKRHCAPMRDTMVDTMVDYISRGAGSDVGLLVDGLRELFGILEAMKLDVANHQIRSLRPLLIQDTVTFQQNYFLRKIASGPSSTGPAQVWYAYAREGQSIDRDSDRDGQIAIFLRALLKLLLSFDPPESFPSTFQIDVDRLWHLRSDVRDTINLKVCDKLFCTLLSRNGYSGAPKSDVLTKVRSSCLSIVEDFEGETRWEDHSKNVALEIARLANDLCGMNNLSVDLVYAEKFLAKAIGSGMGCWPQMLKTTETEIWPSLIDFVNAFEHMSPLDILYQVETHTRRASGRLPYEPSCLARRIAHLGTLHWKVWAPLLYLGPEAARPASPRLEESNEVSEDYLDDIESEIKSDGASHRPCVVSIQQ